MLPEEIDKIKHRIIELGIEHRDLDDAIARLTADPEPQNRPLLFLARPSR